ncbi:MAG: fibronectin type III domain-containing protein, partial [Elusimicrobiales bacterium]|nr:fibronectin type III domain-containing protein [Elusimicrobiales bacterium]
MPTDLHFTAATSSQLDAAWTLAAPGDSPWVALSSDPSFTVLVSSASYASGSESASFASLSPNTTYYLKVKDSADGDAQYTAVVSSATDPAAPLSPAVTAVYPSSAAVSWDSNSNPGGTLYFIEAARDPAFTLGASVATTTWPGAGISYGLQDLSPDSTYHMRIRTLGFGLTDSAFASIGTTVTLTVAPASPFYDAVYSTRAALSWSPEENPYWTIYETQVSTDDFATLNYSTRTAADYSYPYALTPNATHYFRVAAVNGYGHYSGYMTFQSTLTLSAAPAPHATPLTLLADGYNSVTAQWAYNGNPGYTEYYVQASTDPAFGGIDAGNPRPWAAGLSVTVTPLDPSTVYYFRVRSRDLYGRTSGWLDLGSINTSAGADVAPPTIFSTQTGDDTWRGSSGGLYQVYFTDLVSGLARFDVKATTGPDMNSQEIAPWTTAASFAGENEYLTAWPLPDTVFSAIPEGVTAYISVRVYDMDDNVAYSTAAFYVRRDLTAPSAGSPSASPVGWLNADPGAVFSLPFTDALSGLSLVQYSASRSQATGNGNVLGWTTLDTFVSSASWSEAWGVNFDALQDSVTNYISVRAYDAAGNTVQVTDAFRVLKNTIGPFAGVTWPSALFTSSSAAITGTATPSDSDSSVTAVEVALRQESSGLYWDGGAAFSSAAHAWLTPSGLGDWSLDVSTLPLVSLSSYTAVVRAVDDLARYSADHSSFTFTLDTGSPSVSVSTPVADSQVYYFDEVSGSAADGAGGAGLARVEVAVRRTADGRWWNPFQRTWTTAFVSSAAVGGASWAFYPDARLRGELLHELTYYVTASAYDAAYPSNSTGFSVQGTTFTYHDTIP